MMEMNSRESSTAVSTGVMTRCCTRMQMWVCLQASGRGAGGRRAGEQGPWESKKACNLQRRRANPWRVVCAACPAVNLKAYLYLE